MAVEIILDSKQRQTYCLTLINQTKIDGSKTLVLKNTDKSPTVRQQRLWFLWCSEIAVSGLGQDDDKNSVHIRAKWQFVMPILRRDSDMFRQIYDGFMDTVKHLPDRAEKCQEFARDWISTKKLNRLQKAESLRELQLFWTGQGAWLTDPSLQGLEHYGFKKGEL
jgi:hypothetical protein